MLQIESNAAMVVRLVEELLSISRTLKENWILGQLPRTEKEVDVTKGFENKVNLMLEKILMSKKLEEEISGDEDAEFEEEEEEEEEKEEEEGEDQSQPEPQPEMISADKTEDAPEVIEVPEISMNDAPKTDKKGRTESREEVPMETSQIDPMDMSDTADILGDYDFDNFGKMDGDDIMMG
jgi:hypothetical protein